MRTVFLRRAFVFLLMVGPVFVINNQESDNFLIEKPHKGQRSSLSRARREAIEACEGLAHDLTTEIEAVSAVLHETMGSIRGIAEGGSEHPFMDSLRKDRSGSLKMLCEARSVAQKRSKELQETLRYLRQGRSGEKSLK
jgi:hypothetical protein